MTTLKRGTDLVRAPLAAYLVGLLVCSYALYIHRDGLFWNLDGYMVRQSIEGQYRWLKDPLTLGLDPLRGPGTLFFPTNFRLLPIIGIQEFFFSGQISRVLTYVAYAIQTVLVMCLLARHCDLPAKIGGLAGFIIVLLTMPLIWTRQTTLMFPLFLLAPHWFDLLAFVVLFFVIYGRIGRGSVTSTICLTAACALITFLAFAAGPLWSVLVAPFLVAVVLSYLLTAVGSERRAKGLAGAAILASLYLSGVLDFACSIVGSGAVGVFGFEIESYQFGRWWSSMVHQYDRFPVGAVTASLGTLVPAAYIRASTRDNANTACKAAALLTVALGSIFLVAWSIVDQFEFLKSHLRHIRLFYFELLLLPFYALFAALGLSRGLRALTSRLSLPRLAVYATVVPAVMAPVSAGLRDVRDRNPYPQLAGATPITTLLKNDIGVDAGSTFRGRVATIFSAADGSDTPASWDRMVAHDVARYRVQQNDHRFVGLWAFQIPTLQEYSQMLTPGAYFWITRAMSLASDKQDMRNHAIITRPDVPLMKLFGVRYVISPRAISDPEFALRLDSPSGDLLYQIADVNVGQYYARRVVRAESLAEMLHAMGTTGSQLNTTWVYEPVPSMLSPGRVDVIFVPSGIRVTGRSDGTSLILLPFTFSRCFALKVSSGNQGSRLLRANLNMLGLLFTQSIDATLILATGPFTRPGCLAADTRELQRLGIEEAAKEFARGSLAPH